MNPLYCAVQAMVCSWVVAFPVMPTAVPFQIAAAVVRPGLNPEAIKRVNFQEFCESTADTRAAQVSANSALLSVLASPGTGSLHLHGLEPFVLT